MHHELVSAGSQKEQKKQQKLEQKVPKHSKLPASARPDATPQDVIDREEGYKFIIKHGPSSNKNSEQNIWADLHCNFYRDSKISG